MVYQWKHGSKVGVDPQIAGEELERIRTWNNGRLEAKAVVDASRDPGAPLHGIFEWNDRKAATAWRVEQAKYVIRSVEIVIDRGAEESPPIRAFVSVQRDEDRSYTSTVHALAVPDLRAQVLDQAWRELEAWRRRHAELVELAKVFAVIDQARVAK
jgi:hypothetical protein